MKTLPTFYPTVLEEARLQEGEEEKLQQSKGTNDTR
jgi:hypothetical protein